MKIPNAPFTMSPFWFKVVSLPLLIIMWVCAIAGVVYAIR